MPTQYTVPDAAETQLLTWLVSAALAVDESLWLRLFQNDYTPGQGTLTANFQEANFAGYLPVLLPRAGWAAPVLTNHVATVEPTASPFSFQATQGSQTVYGVFLVGGVTGITYYCRRFDTPRTVDPNTPLLVRPVISLSSPQQVS